MEDQELLELLRRRESDRVERKASAADRDAIAEAICAFANDLPNHRRPGVVFVGVNDDGSCANLQITDKTLLSLAAIRSDGNILPLPVLLVQERTLNGCDLVVVVVQPSDAPPVRLRGRTCIRVGPRRGYATPEEERILAEKRRAGDLPFDLHPVRSALLADLDLDLFRREYLPHSVDQEVLAQNERTEEQQLLSLRCVSSDTPPLPTILGLLVLGKDPRQFVPCSYIQFLRIDGTELTDAVKHQQEIAGPLQELLYLLEKVLEAQISVSAEVVQHVREVRRPDFPIVALRQLASNAVLHRTYEGTNAPVRITWFNDRIEIQNPGGPYGQVNRQNFGQPGVTDYRNPHLAEAMKNLGYVQRFGMGIPLAQQELAKNGNPPAEFAVEDNHVLVLVKRRP